MRSVSCISASLFSFPFFSRFFLSVFFREERERLLLLAGGADAGQ